MKVTIKRGVILRTLIFAILGLAFFFTLTPLKTRANPFEYKWQQLAPDVWAAIREDAFELPQEGNSVFVVTNEGVVVFDAGGSPLMGESIVAKVKSVTDKPITHIVISHWHGDHMRGLQGILAAFPKAVVYTHPHSRVEIVATQDRWLKRRVSMVPNLRKGLVKMFETNTDQQGRPFIKEEKAWYVTGEKILDQLDAENNRTTYVVPTATFDGQMTLYMGSKEIQFLHLGNAHTEGDLVMWLPKEKILASGDIVTAPIPLMPSPYMDEYPSVLAKLKALGFTTLVPGHGAVLQSAEYLDLMSDTITTVSKQMKVLVAQGLNEENATAKIDYSSVENRFTHGDPFLKNRFQDYVAGALAHTAYLIETGKKPEEVF